MRRLNLEYISSINVEVSIDTGNITINNPLMFDVVIDEHTLG